MHAQNLMTMVGGVKQVRLALHVSRKEASLASLRLEVLHQLRATVAQHCALLCYRLHCSLKLDRVPRMLTKLGSEASVALRYSTSTVLLQRTKLKLEELCQTRP